MCEQNKTDKSKILNNEFKFFIDKLLGCETNCKEQVNSPRSEE